MFKSLRSRVLFLAALVCAGSLAVSALLLAGARDERSSFLWVRHTQEVINQLDMIDRDLRTAEAGLRGYFMSGGSLAYLDDYDARLKQAKAGADAVRALVTDNAAQEQSAIELAKEVDQRAAAMAGVAAKARTRAGKLSQDPIRAGRAKQASDRISRRIAAMRDVERRLLDLRAAQADRLSSYTSLLVLLSAPLFIALVAGAAWAIIRGIERPLLALLEAVGRFGEGERAVRVSPSAGRSEFGRLGAAYNAMADSLVQALEKQEASEQALARVNDELIAGGEVLKQRSGSIELISSMSQRLQALREPGELSEVLECFLPQVLPNLSGQLYLFNNSRNLLVRAASWGGVVEGPETFAPDDCWGLRRGLPHLVGAETRDVRCRHADPDCAADQLCKPVMAGGQILGLLYVQGAIGTEDRFRLVLVAENVALAVVNENLRKRLKEQSIRDPLTRLFNRRYLEEALTLESARSSRNDTPLSVIMTDVDHFKRFNDTHGHPAGDALLKELAGLMQAQFRDGDIICRYGGEEFAIIAPGADLDLIARRAEALRLAAHQLKVSHDGRDLGPITMSFGIASSPGRGGPTGHDLIAQADHALYRAKRGGRDRVEVGEPSQTMRSAAA